MEYFWRVSKDRLFYEDYTFIRYEDKIEVYSVDKQKDKKPRNWKC